MLLTDWLRSWIFRHRVKTPLFARRRQLKTQMMAARPEQCEPRWMLTSVVAEDDSFAIQGRTVGIVVDVLVNDSTTATGGLEISGLNDPGLLQPSHGSVTLIPGNPAATGRAARDRIIYAGDGLFVGVDTFEYEVLDEDGNRDVALVAINVMSLASAEVDEDENGQQIIAGGLGGTGYEADPTTGYNPNISGNIDYEVTNEDDWELPIGLGDDPDATGTGTQSTTQTVATTDDGNGNWSYTEAVTWTYDLSVSGEGTDQNAVWGTSTYILGVTSIGGTITTTYSFSSEDRTESSISTTMTDSGSGAVYTDESWSIYSFSLTVQHIDYANGSKAGSQSSTSTNSSGYIRTGTYSYDTTGGSVDGTYLTSIGDSQTSSYLITWSEDPVLGWNGIGTSSDSGYGDTSSEYSGSGTYGDTNFDGTILEGGGQLSHYGYTTTGAYTTALGWLTTGTGSASGSQNDNRSYDGTGTYTSDKDGVLKSGTTVANGHNNSLSNYSVSYTLGSGAWTVASSSGSGSGDSDDFSSYSGSGTYSRAITGGTVNGTVTEEGHTHSFNSYTTAQTIGSGGTWVMTGSGSGGTDGDSDSEFSGSGSYATSGSSQSGTVTQSMSGTVTESGSSSTEYSSSANWSLGDEGWELSSGTGTESGSDHMESESSGEGTYSRNVPLSSGGYQASVSGNREEEGTYTSDNNWSASNEVAGGEWIRASGSGSGSVVETKSSKYSGTGTYNAIGPYSAAISGSITESGGETQNTDASTTSDWSAGAWVTSGSAVTVGTNNAISAYSGSGSFGWTDRPASGGGTTSMEGGATQNGNSEASGGFTLISNLDSSGSWIPTTGTGTQSGVNNAAAAYSGSGSYAKSGDDEEFGLWSIDGTSTTNGNQNEGSSYNSETEFIDDDWVLVDGSGSASGGSTGNYSYSGSGTYLYEDEDVTVPHDITQSGSELESSDWATVSTVVSGSGGGEWATSGNGSGETSFTESTNFIGDSGTFAMPVEGGVIAGEFTDYFNRTSNDNSEYEVTIDAEGDWFLSSGSGSGSYSEGFGTHASGSGALAWDGDYVDENEEVIGGYAFSGTGEYTYDETDSAGSFATYEVQDGEWVTTDSGALANGDMTESYTWNGTGTDERLGMVGEYTQGGGNGSKFHTEVSQGSSGSASGTGYSKASGNYSMIYSGSDELYIYGIFGLLTTDSTETNNWNTQIDLEWQTDDFVATSGSGSETSVWNDLSSFSGSASTSSSGFSATASYNYSQGNDYTENTDWEYDVNEDEWIQSGGEGSGSGSITQSSSQSTTEAYETEDFQVPGTETASSWDNYGLEWEYLSEFTPGSSGGWTSAGEGSGAGSVGNRSGYSASGSISSGDMSGTYDEGGSTYESFDYELELGILDDSWITVGIGTGNGNGDTHKTIHLENNAWSASAYGGNVTGTESEDQNESSDYEFTYEAELLPDAEDWSITSGSGSGGGSASYNYAASGSGAYSASFDSGAGTLNGTNTVSENHDWDYDYVQDYEVVDGEWVTTETGSGTSHDSTFSGYSGSGSHSSGSDTGLVGDPTWYMTGSSTSAYGTLEENGYTSQSADSEFSWIDDDWTETINDSESSLSHSHHGSGTLSVYTTATGPLYTGAAFRSDLTFYNTVDTVSHSESSSAGVEIETHIGDAVAWSKSHSGTTQSYNETSSASGSRQIITGSLTADNTFGTTVFDHLEENSSWQTESADDGSSLDAGSSGGNHQWSTTTYNGPTSSAFTVSSGSSSWSEPWYDYTPPDEGFSSRQGSSEEWLLDDGGETNNLMMEEDESPGFFGDFNLFTGTDGGEPKKLRTKLAENIASDEFKGNASSPQSQQLDQLTQQLKQKQDAAAEVLADPEFMNFGVGITEEQLVSAAQTLATIGAGATPGVGEIMDLATLFDPNTTRLEKGLAAGSLGISALTAGYAPNFGSIRGLFRGGSKTAGEVGQQVARNGDEVADAARQGCKIDGCFPAGTLVASESGLRPIETIQVGERVWSLDMTQERWELRPVSKAGGFEYEGGIIRLQIAGEIVESTDHHPFWVVEGRDLENRPNPKHAAPREVESDMPGRWVDALYLQECDTLQLMSGIRVVINAIDTRITKELVYNFRVDEYHCYAVGKHSVLVHNNIDDCPLSASNSAQDVLSNLPGKSGKTGPIKTVPDTKALNDLFDSLSDGAKTVDSGTYPGIVKELPDGTIIRMRPGSKSGGATIDATLPNGKIIKVHIES